MSAQRLNLTLAVALAVVLFLLGHALFSKQPIVIKRYDQPIYTQTKPVFTHPVVVTTPTATPLSYQTATDTVTTPTSSVFTADQLRLLHIAHEEGQRVGWPETIQALLLQESRAGAAGRIGDRRHAFGRRSYCPMQIKLVAARDVLRHYPDLGHFTTDEELLAELLTNDRFCIRVGAHYFKLMVDNTTTWKQAVLAYNRGLGGARHGEDPANYVAGIRKQILTKIRPHSDVLSLTQQVALTGV